MNKAKAQSDKINQNAQSEANKILEGK